MNFKFAAILQSKGVEHPQYCKAQLIGWLSVWLLWSLVYLNLRADSDPVIYFLGWNTLLFLLFSSVSHWLLKPFYWWLSRTVWSIGKKISSFLLLVHFCVWGIVGIENIWFQFIPIPVAGFSSSLIGTMTLYHMLFIFWGLIYHHWTWQGYRSLEKTSENPRYYFGGQLIGWLLISGVWYMLYIGRGSTVEVDMDYFRSWVVVYYCSGIILTHFILRPFYKHLLYLSMGLVGKLLLSLLMLYLCNMIGVIITVIYFSLADITVPDRTEDVNLASFIISYAVLMLWSFVYAGWLSWQQKQDDLTRALKLESSLREAKLSGLKQQLNPHFIFNALNSLRALILKDQQAARQMVTGIANLLRYSLYQSDEDTVALAQEIEIVEDYLSIERLRYQGRVSVNWDIPSSLMGIQVLPLCIQTLVENAIKHTINQYAEGIFINISARQESNTICLIVENRGRIAESTDETTGIGLKNTRERLVLIFGEEASLTLAQKDETNTGELRVEAKITLPLSQKLKSTDQVNERVEDQSGRKAGEIGVNKA